MTIDAYALIALDATKSYLGISNTNDDTIIEDCINRASNYIEAFCDRQFAVRTDIVEWHQCTGPYIIPRQTPITRIYSLQKGEANALSVTLGTENSSYVLGMASVTELTTVLRRVDSTGTTTTSYQAWASYSLVSSVVTQMNTIDGITATTIVDGPSSSLCPTAPIDMLNKTAYLTYPDEDVKADYDPSRSRIVIRDGTQGRVLLRYYAGYETIPYAVQDCCMQLTKDLYVSRRYDTGLVLSDTKAQPDFLRRQELMQSMLAQFKEIR